MKAEYPLPISAHTPTMKTTLPVSANTFPVNAQPRARECGTCTLCCKVMGIDQPDFKKPKDCWCAHAKKGKGCGIYETRPSVCRDFSCLWLQGDFGGPAYRPDKIHAVVTATTDGKNWVVHEDPGYQGFARDFLHDLIMEWIQKDRSHYVVVVCGKDRKFYGQREKFEALMAVAAPEVVGAKNITEKGRSHD